MFKFHLDTDNCTDKERYQQDDSDGVDYPVETSPSRTASEGIRMRSGRENDLPMRMRYLPKVVSRFAITCQYSLIFGAKVTKIL